MKFSQFSSNFARGFNLDRWWKLYKKAHKSKGLLKEYYTLRYMRMASKNGGYCGRTTVIKGKPIMHHGFHGVHLSRHAVIGENASIFQNVTITSGVTVGDNCLIGAGANLVGKITIGNNVRIDAGTTVVESVPDNCTVVGAKARLIQHTPPFLNTFNTDQQ